MACDGTQGPEKGLLSDDPRDDHVPWRGPARNEVQVPRSRTRSCVCDCLDAAGQHIVVSARRCRVRQAHLAPPHMQQIGMDIVPACNISYARTGSQALLDNPRLLRRRPSPTALRTRQNRHRTHHVPIDLQINAQTIAWAGQKQ